MEFLGNDHLAAGKVEIPPEVVDVGPVQMAEDAVSHDKDGDEVGVDPSGQDHKHEVDHDGREELVDPLHTEGELEQKGSREKGKDMTGLSVGQHVHDHSERIAEKETESVIACLDIESN